MKMPPLTRRQQALVQCAPFNGHQIKERNMRAAVFRVRKADEFANQQAFDRAVAAVVRATPIPAEVEEWFSKQTIAAPPRRTWKTIARNPAILAIAIAVVVITAVFVFQFIEHRNDFPGAETARRLLTTASSSRSVLLDPVKTDSGALGDLFFMKHRLEHYDVPPEFADLKTIGCRVFDDEDSRRIAQIWVVEQRMQFFLFPAERDAKTGRVLAFPGWRYVKNQEGWTGVVAERNGVCFMAALRGPQKDLARYVSKTKQ
jgi:hypothetical protein